MVILFDIGNTNTHLGLANRRGVFKRSNIPTTAWFDRSARKRLLKFAGVARLEGAILCSVVPRATPLARRMAKALWKLDCLELTPRTLRGIGIDYPKPETIGPDRLANA